MNFFRSLIVACAVLLSVLPAASHGRSFSGSSSSNNQSDQPSRFTPQDIIAFAKKVERSIAAEGAQVAILARMGRPLSDMPDGMRYTHAAFAVYAEITTADGRKLPGYAIYNLYRNDKQPDTSELVQDYPADFFSGVAELEAGIIIPSPELQRRLLDVITSPTYASLHDPHYSLIANPYTLGRQNCTEFVLDVINAAIYQTSDPHTLKANAKAFFDAQPVNVNPLKLLLGSIFSAEVSLSDQPGKPVTATFERLASYLQRYDSGSKQLEILP